MRVIMQNKEDEEGRRSRRIMRSRRICALFAFNRIVYFEKHL